MATVFTGAQKGALDDIAREINQGTFGPVDLSILDGQLRDLGDAIVAYLAEQTGGRVFKGDSRLYKQRLLGLSLDIVFVPRPDASNPVRPEYWQGARCLSLAVSDWGLYDLGGPADKERLAITAPNGLPLEYVLPEWVR